jgi:hypothetical protein
MRFKARLPMSQTILHVTGPAAKGARVDAPMLRDLLDALVDAVREAVRLRAEGRSRAPGAIPAWLEKAAAFDVELSEGQAQLALTAAPLGSLVPERFFAQLDMFDPVSPAATCLDVFVEALDDALANRTDSDRYDDGLIETLTGFGKVLDHEVRSFELRNGSTRKIERDTVEALRELRRSIPADQRVRVAGKLDLLKHSSRIFSLELPSGAIRGVVASETDMSQLGQLLGTQVVVSGLAKFRPSGRVLRVEADQVVPAVGDTSLWEAMPRPLLPDLDVHALRAPQGPRSGVAAIFGRLPEDESDDDFDAAVRALS